MSKTQIKLNVLLAKTDHLAAIFKKNLEDYVKFFKTSQGAFKGERKTYTPNANAVDDPSMRSNKLVVTTVNEKLKWLSDVSAEYIDALFSQEKTNSSGIAKAVLKVDDITFGEFTSLELLKLKSLLESGAIQAVYEHIPVRNDDEIWSPTDADMYKNREGIYQSDLQTGQKKTTLKEHYVLSDPNASHIKTDYKASIASKDTVIELGDYTYQRYSGEWTHQQRAELLYKRSKLLVAVITALKEANEAEAIPSAMTSEKLFTYLYKGV